MPVFIPKDLLNFTFRKENKPTELRIGITNPAVMRVERGGRNSRFVL